MSLDDARNCGVRLILDYHPSVHMGFMEIGKFSSFNILRSLVALIISFVVVSESTG